jgi:hypothetical protein
MNTTVYRTMEITFPYIGEWLDKICSASETEGQQGINAETTNADSDSSESGTLCFVMTGML